MRDQLIQSSDSSVVAAHEKFQVSLPTWTGPYDLLLKVIDEQDLNLFDLNISILLDRFLEYVEKMENPDLDEAGEFLVVAATLAQIKSKMLLPQEEKEDDEEEEDPRERLVQYLLEYQKFKEAAQQLRERPILGRDVFAKGARENFQGLEAEGHGTLFQLVKGFQKAIHRVEVQEPFEIDREEVSVNERFQQIFGKLQKVGELSFEKILDENLHKSFVIASFLAVLELVRMKKIKIFQREQDGPVFLQFQEGATAEDVVHSEFDEEREEANDGSSNEAQSQSAD